MSSTAEVQIKKLYKESVECVKYLDRLMSQDNTDFSEFFSLRTLTTQNKLCDYCEKILFLKPLIYGKRAEEIIWRKCFYEPIHKIRRNLHALSESDICHYYKHLSSAAGYYSNILIKIQQEFNFELSYSFDMSAKQLPWNKYSNITIETSKTLHDFAFTLCHRVLIYLGDLARYQQEFEQSVDIRLAQHYYHWALRLKPFHGQPHNQLGTLFTDLNYGIDSAFCYLRCIFSAESFMGADGNLTQLLEKNKILYKTVEQELSNIGDLNQVPNDLQIKYCLVGYLNLFKVLYDDSEDNDIGPEWSQISQKFVQSFTVVVELMLGKTSDESRQFCTGPLLKMFVCQTILIKKLQDKGSYKASAAKGLLISLFVVILDRIIDVLHKRNSNTAEHAQSIVTAIAPMNGHLFDNSTNDCQTEEGYNLSNGEKVSTKQLNCKVKKVNVHNVMLRRRHRDEFSEEEDKSSDEATNSSEDEDDVIEIEDSEDEIEEKNQMMNELKVENGAKINLECKEETTRKITPEFTAKNIPKLSESEIIAVEQQKKMFSKEIGNANIDKKGSEIEITDTVNFLVENSGWMVVVKTLCDWFRCHPTVIAPLGAISTTLWPKLFKFVNLLPNDSEIEKFTTSNETVSKEFKCINIFKSIEFEQKYPLVEDVYLRGIPPLTQAHTGLDFESHWSCGLQSEIITRILCIRSFAHYLVNLNIHGLSFDEEKMFFSVQLAGSVDNVPNQETKRHSHDKNKREALMRSMAKLRIKDEMKSIEKVAWIPVYLILDTTCLLKSSPSIKRLLSRRKFILVIPESVLARLDRLKKDSLEAREAIRWLEIQLKSGNKFIRAQKSEETTDGILNEAKFSAILNDCVDIREVRGVVDCSAYFSQTVAGSASTVACILTGERGDVYRKKIDDDFYREKKTNYKEIFAKLISAADLKGVNVENARVFLDRWLKYDGTTRRSVGRMRGNS